MTQEEKHALIAERLELWTNIQRCDNPWDEASDGEIFGTARGVRCRVRDYSTDLNLCRHVELKIAEMGYVAKTQYLRFLHAAVGIAASFDYQHTAGERFLVATAPASARVDAMVALIQGMERAA